MRISGILDCLDGYELAVPGGLAGADGLSGIEIIKKIDVVSLHHDSRLVKSGGLFFALSGTRTSGAKYAAEALRNGAVCIVTKRKLKNPCLQIIVPDVRIAMSLIAKAFYNSAADKMQIIAVVGTNGKTTCTHILKHILEANKEKCGVIGTLGVYCNGEIIKSSMTTPDPIDLHRIFAEMHACGTRTVIMEASAHAIFFKKLYGINFRTAVFTNITPDHLDFFPSFEKYRDTKIGFMLDGSIETAVVNADEQLGQFILNRRRFRSVRYSLKGIDLQLFSDKSVFKIDGQKAVLNLPARFNVYNALACITAAQTLGLSLNKILKTLNNLPVIDGRFNTYTVKQGVTVIIDYAHTPDGLEKIILSAKEILNTESTFEITNPADDSSAEIKFPVKSLSDLKQAGQRIITVFGCGGERDKTKRPVMGEISAKYSDYTVVTSDNPRGEKPFKIMRQIEKGIKRFEKKCRRFEKSKRENKFGRTENKSVLNEINRVCEDKYTLIEDRTEAVNFALYKAKPGDIVIIAGKGGETFTEIGGRKIQYSDEVTVKNYQKNYQNDIENGIKPPENDLVFTEKSTKNDPKSAENHPKNTGNSPENEENNLKNGEKCPENHAESAESDPENTEKHPENIKKHPEFERKKNPENCSEILGGVKKNCPEIDRENCSEVCGNVIKNCGEIRGDVIKNCDTTQTSKVGS